MPIDRNPNVLTSYRVPTMARPGAPRPELDSIYGDTHRGVPNPMVPHRHPYPTRYHGAVLDYPQPAHDYVRSPYAKAPYDGLGADPFFGRGTSFTGYQFLDVAIGAYLGWIAATKEDAAPVHAIVGGLAAMSFGAPGMVAFLAAEVLMSHRERGLRKDIQEDIGALGSKVKAKLAGR